MNTPTLPRRHRLATLVAAGAVALTACGGDGGSLPSDPDEAVAQALQNSLGDEFRITLSLEFSDDARQMVLAEMGNDVPEGFGEAFLDGEVSLAGKDGQVAMGLSLGGEERLGFRALGDAFYVHADVPWLVEVGGDEFPQSNVDQMRGMSMFLGDLGVLIEPALDGDWVGVDDVPSDWQDQLTELAESAGGDLGIDSDTLDYSDIDLADLLASSMTATEIDGGYDVTLDLRGLLTTLVDRLPAGVVNPDDMAEIDRLPTSVGGITLLVDGNRVSQLRVDGYNVAKSIDPEIDDDEMGEGDLTIVIDVSADDGGMLSAPGDAVTVAFETVLDTLGLLANMGG